MSHPQRKRTSNKKKSERRTGFPWLPVIMIALVALVAVGVIAGGNSSDSGTVAERDPEIVAAGAELFQANCATCHGTDLNGTDTGPPFLNAIYAPNHHGDEAFQIAVQLGVQPHHWSFGPMAPIAGLDREDVAKIVAYVRSQQEAAGILRDPSHP
jgi:mono/diheme cytochrome c family protein